MMGEGRLKLFSFVLCTYSDHLINCNYYSPELLLELPKREPPFLAFPFVGALLKRPLLADVAFTEVVN